MDKKYEKLEQYQRRFGHCFVPKRFDCNLYNFVNIQRRDYRAKFIGDSKNKKEFGTNDKRIKMLQTIGFVFEIKKTNKRKVSDPNNIISVLGDNMMTYIMFMKS